jgi:glutamate dehydrogenase
MTGDNSSPFSQQNLRNAFCKALGQASLTTVEQDYVDQAFDDAREDELPGVPLETLGALLAQAWGSADRLESGPLVRILHCQDPSGAALDLDMLVVAQQDAPFLVDSVMGELADGGFDVRAMFHPVVSVSRDADGRRTDKGEARRESMIVVVLAPVGEDRGDALCAGVNVTLSDVRSAVADFEPMRALLHQTIQELQSALTRPGAVVMERWLKARGSRAPGAPAEAIEEYLHFLRWLGAEHFVFLGARIYDYPRLANGDYAPEEPGHADDASLGVLRDNELAVLRRANEPAILTSALKGYLETSPPIIVAKSNLRSRVHRRAYMDYVGVKRYAPDGAAIGEVRFVGLFTAEAYDEAARDIPLIRRKIAHILNRAGENPSAHNEKRLRNIIEGYPRDELFQADDEDLYDTAMGVLHLFDRPRVRLFVRRDPFDRFISILFFTPRDRYNSETRELVGRMLAEAWGGRVSAYYPAFGAEPLARVHFVLGVTPNRHSEPDLGALERRIDEATRTWTDRFAQAARSGGVTQGTVAELLSKYGHAFPAGYQDHYDAAEALLDVAEIEALDHQPAALRVRAYRLADDAATAFRFKVYHSGDTVPLADVLPILDHMGLKALVEEGFPVRREGHAEAIWVHEFILDDPRGGHLVFADIKDAFEETFEAVWAGRAESDGFNRLVIELGLSWREAALIRALARYRQQTGLDPSQAVQQEALRDHPGIARLMMDLFRIQFHPAIAASLDERKRQADEVFREIVSALQGVESLDADRSLRRMAQLVKSLKRTNFYQTGEDGQPKPYISFKIASRELDDLPAPKPYREIFVAAPHVEGVHLRFGPVARGGLRWSDRRDDFRTEVLGLVKAQQVKNAVIVPVGSKGGFYPKQLPKQAGSDAWRAEGVRAYRTFLSGLLDITDNLDAKGEVVRPGQVIAHDADDPYLVVAADKGTATFSDIANGVAQDYGFWLGDAFASGGSVGYDHKAMGITARGAWEAVKRHFREMGKDIQTQPFTCVGVGDMSGDVFGNGMLLSKATQLVAAFDHRHIFIDPTPDPGSSWDERARLFALPRSSWADYRAELISEGGGIFARTAKTIALTPQIKDLLDIEADEVTPLELIQSILRARIELLYLGGIGTYVKAPSETHAAAGDKANDAIRIDGTELRCKVVGEGANLGFTQAGRIAFARTGGRINTDAIDNSAGVDTSDHEVNIKILTGQLERAGDLNRPDRDVLLASMTEDVGHHVLAHNYAQTLCLTLQEAQAVSDLPAHANFMDLLEGQGRLDRKVEGLPGRQQVSELRAAGRGLTRPELAVLTAYGKLELDADIVASNAPDDPWFEQMLVSYFPAGLAKYEPDMRRHRLRREIIATRMSNQIVDMAGPTFASRLMAATGADAALLAKTFFAARQIFRLDEVWAAVNSLDLKIPAAAQSALYQEIARVLRGQVYWLAQRLVRSGEAATATVGGLIETYRAAADTLQISGSELLSDFGKTVVQQRLQSYLEAGAPDALARTVAGLAPLTATTDIADLAKFTGWTVAEAARFYHQTGAAFGYDRLRAAAAALRPSDLYERAAVRSLIGDMINEQTDRSKAIAALAAKAAGGTSVAGSSLLAATAAIDAWVGPRHEVVERGRKVVNDIEQSGDGWSFAKLTLAHAALRAGG